MKRMSVGVILGGVTFFAWGAISWMVLPFHNKTLKPLNEEQLISDTLKVVLKEPGFYMFPYCKPDASKEEKAAGMAKVKTGPTGVLIFDPNGKDPMSPKYFITSFLIGLFASLISMLVLAFSRDRVQGLGARVLLLIAIGVCGWAVSDLMYMNWFGFPCGFVLASLLDWVVGFALLGVVLNRFVPTYE